jgi:hypothetical protein
VFNIYEKIMTGKSFQQISSDLELKLESKLAVKIINTVKQLPDEIYEYVVRNVQFEKAMDCCLPLPEIKKSFIVLVKEDASEGTIAHEIAHAYLKHPAYTDVSVEQAEKFEREAKALSDKWLKSSKLPS